MYVREGNLRRAKSPSVSGSLSGSKNEDGSKNDGTAHPTPFGGGSLRVCPMSSHNAVTVTRGSDYRQTRRGSIPCVRSSASRPWARRARRSPRRRAALEEANGSPPSVVLYQIQVRPS